MANLEKRESKGMQKKSKKLDGENGRDNAPPLFLWKISTETIRRGYPVGKGRKGKNMLFRGDGEYLADDRTSRRKRMGAYPHTMGRPRRVICGGEEECGQHKGRRG